MTDAASPETEFPRTIGRVATRELASHGYTRWAELTAVTERDLLAIHGVGHKAVGILREELVSRGLSFSKES